MNEVKIIKVRLRNGEMAQCTIELTRVPPWKLIFSGLDFDKKEFVGDDLFNAFVALRRELEREGAMLLCAGARRDVFPSGMSRDMGGGRKAYICRLKNPAQRTDLVDIFDEAESNDIGTVEEQNAFHEKWIQSIRS